MRLLVLLAIGCEASKDPVTSEPVEPEPTTPPETTPPVETTDCVSATIDRSGGTLDAGELVAVFPPDAFGAGTTSEASICVTEAPEGVTPLTSVWALTSDAPLVLPVTVTLVLPGSPADAAVFVPDPAGLPTRSLVATEDDGGLAAPMYRAGLVYAATDDRLVVPYVAGGVADLLFVVDNSCSMSDEQFQLVSAFPVLTDFLAADDTSDFHIGVVSTDLDSPSHDGRLREVAGARWIDRSTVDPEDVFGWMVAMGTAGSGAEKGIGGAYTAIELRADGYNAGFLRDESRLSIAVMSDEPDSTPNNLISQPQFENYLLGLTSHAGVRFHSLVDPQVGGDYTTTSNAVGGAVMDIAMPDYTGFLEAVLDGMRTRMELDPAAAAEPEAWWLPADGTEQQRVAEDLVAFDGSSVVVDTSGFAPDDVIWLLYAAAP